MRFTTSSLYQKTCNISADEDFNQVVDTGLLKKLISGDRTSAEFKGKDRFDFYPVATMLILINNDIPFNDHSYGLRRRFIVIEFPKQFTVEDNNSNVNLIETLCLQENLQYIVFKALNCFARVLRTQRFTIPESVSNRTKKYMLENNIAAKFINDNPEYKKYEIPCRELYDKYIEWADNNNENKISSEQFGRLILNKQVGFIKGKEKKIEGQPRRNTYIGPEYDKTKVWNPNISECDVCKYKAEFNCFNISQELLDEIKDLKI